MRQSVLSRRRSGSRRKSEGARAQAAARATATQETEREQAFPRDSHPLCSRSERQGKLVQTLASSASSLPSRLHICCPPHTQTDTDRPASQRLTVSTSCPAQQSPADSSLCCVPAASVLVGTPFFHSRLKHCSHSDTTPETHTYSIESPSRRRHHHHRSHHHHLPRRLSSCIASFTSSCCRSA